MSETNDRLARLRLLLAQEHSEEKWLDILQEMSKWILEQEPDLEVGLDYVASTLNRLNRLADLERAHGRSRIPVLKECLTLISNIKAAGYVIVGDIQVSLLGSGRQVTYSVEDEKIKEVLASQDLQRLVANHAHGVNSHTMTLYVDGKALTSEQAVRFLQQAARRQQGLSA